MLFSTLFKSIKMNFKIFLKSKTRKQRQIIFAQINKQTFTSMSQIKTWRYRGTPKESIRPVIEKITGMEIEVLFPQLVEDEFDKLFPVIKKK
jgi:hypothetical protein